ncbi:interactor of constitutive active ROPs 3-like [Olea europaea var. sylvestris]|uniref:interactor of constitutive active ROPs 3-like n=1 Tax=Olea europaea var. sylvestris TaxID=158386 RepID=UPI000C1D0B87|nr:interactor of constitutive active ROPs 3-like [Olea europaea var. sylvestris]XP_022875088.1 interactor of constitutive active ROPs 3-like [Olea europaea var. sylvestris]XP_022875089.1 interactor of constitutive active ROPs 3-like [Olea europaea var. sylvestris]
MQTPKARKTSTGTSQKASPQSMSSEVPHKTSPRAGSSEMSQKSSPQVVRKLKTAARDSDQPASSSNLYSRVPKEISPKVADRRLSNSPVSEKQRPSKVAELEHQISQLEHDLKTVKDQLCSSEASKKQALKDSEESNQKLLALSAKLEESRKQLLEQSNIEKGHIIEICKNSEERDRTLQSELDAIKNDLSVDSAALTSALNEIKQLKLQLEMVAESEATQTKNSESAQSELHNLKEKLGETLLIVEDMKKQLRDCTESEARAQVLAGETLKQLEIAKKTVESLRSDGFKAIEVYDAIASELGQSRARVTFLEELVSKLKSGTSDSLNEGDCKTDFESKESERSEESIEAEVTSSKLEVERLRRALEAAEIKYNEEQSRSAEQMRSAYQLMEQMKSQSSQREAELEFKLRLSEDEMEELKENLMDKETELQGICDENEQLMVRLETSLQDQREYELEKELQKSKKDLEDLRANLMDKETELQYVSEENETLKLKIKEINMGNLSDEVASEVESARCAEQEALMKVEYMTEEVEKNNRRTTRMAEQLEAAQATNAEMETDLRRLKVQSDQWRKAAEAAASMLPVGNNGKLMERTGSMDSNYSPRMGKISSPCAENVDEDLLKKKNANMLKRLGVLWKKPQK